MTKKFESLSKEAQDTISNAVYEAGAKAKAEASMVSTQAQRLFYEFWNVHGSETNLKDAIIHFKKCMNMADEIRTIVENDFSGRIKQYDGEMRSKYKKSNIILPSAEYWKDSLPMELQNN